METVIFDLDGTLADTSADLIAAANVCFARRGLGSLLDRDADKLTAFHGGRAMLRLGFSRADEALGEEEVDREYPLFLEVYGENIDRETKLYPGAEAALRSLLDTGVKIGICTNKPENLAETLMSRLGVRDLFGSLIGADTLPVRKPDPEPYRESVRRAGGDPARSVLIGDTETDVLTARAAGVPIVLVTFGPEGPDIARLKPDALLEGYADLPDLAGRLGGS
ncbi:MAG: HAD-IA family hydrolase [Silicimonas sp.]|nr:HAD-IA family hydrolase [Silicimonas sp.]